MLFEDFAEALVHRRPSLIARLRSFLSSPLDPTSRWSAYKLCGLRLRPFSRWHAANLDFIESPFVGHAKRPVTFAEYWLAAECCRLRFPHRLHLPNNWLYRFRRILAERKYLKNPKREINAFAAYISDYSSRPEMIPGEDAQPIRTPWYLYEVCLLQRLDPNGFKSRADAWNFPVGEGGWLIAGNAEAAGQKIDIVTPEDRAHELSEEEFAENERQEALIAKEGGA